MQRMKTQRFKQSGVAFVFVLTLVSVWGVSSSASAAVCEQFTVGSAKWQSCVEDAAGGGGEQPADQPGGKESEKSGGGGGGGGVPVPDLKGPEDAACSEFNVGSPKWTDCIEGAATGGGLMPWIVVIPLGVMVLGMAIIFPMQMRRGRGSSVAAGRAGGTAAVWLMFVGLLQLAMGAGAAVAEARADGSSGGYFIAAAVMIPLGVILLVIGIVLAVKSKGTRKIVESGIAGTGTVVAADETGMTVNDQPMLVFTLDIEAPTLAPYRATSRSTVPFLAVSQLSQGMKLPVKIDPDNNQKVYIDWDNWTMNRMAPGGAIPAVPT
jgi:hypothetical protein